MKILAHEIRLVTPEEFDELVWKKNIGFHFVCYSREDGGYVACLHDFETGGNQTAGEVFADDLNAIDWIRDNEDMYDEVKE